jgi:S1-C subfamily serine protease
MKRATLYSSSGKSRAPAREAASRIPDKAQEPEKPRAPKRTARLDGWLGRHERPVYLCAGVLLVMLVIVAQAMVTTPRPALTSKDVDAAVQRFMENKPSTASLAYESVRGSVVMVRGMGADVYEEGDSQKAVGSGVVLVDSGIILTNLHVAIAGERLQVVFADGTESEAEVLSVKPEQDLAVLKAKTLPDDLQAATLGSADALQQGDEVIAVGFPFGIGPSVSSGVVSGLKREYRSPEGHRVLDNLIQFDAAANPGNSGGPLVTAKGEVVGIVTGILNPTDQRVFIGIGFAVPIEAAAAAAGQPPF